ncbi:Laccase-12 [Acorus gramineus]|uniref:Laccase-12 n=1 Tax=Acorus gramineus TaxID=55184 RepID=A0AAV9B6L4_ACOGR|nr:Laccase-12 [Acorus gramineus]
MRTAWADRPESVTQCQIRPGGNYTYRFTIEGQEGTLWWHAHSSWLHATVYGALIIYPKPGSSYPFPKPKREAHIILGQNHPIHLHGYDFYILAQGFGNFNLATDKAKFNMVDPPLRNTMGVPVNGWAVIRFKADNPGDWGAI